LEKLFANTCTKKCGKGYAAELVDYFMMGSHAAHSQQRNDPQRTPWHSFGFPQPQCDYFKQSHPV
jgi:hypothetical protein